MGFNNYAIGLILREKGIAIAWEGCFTKAKGLLELDKGQIKNQENDTFIVSPPDCNYSLEISKGEYLVMMPRIISGKYDYEVIDKETLFERYQQIDIIEREALVEYMDLNE